MILQQKTLKAFDKVWDLQTKQELFVFGAASYVPPQAMLQDQGEPRAQAIMQVIE